MVTRIGRIPCSVVEDPEHGHNAVGVAVGAPDVTASGSNVVHGQPNAAGTLGYASTLFQCVINPLQAQHTWLVTSMLPNIAPLEPEKTKRHVGDKYVGKSVSLVQLTPKLNTACCPTG